MSVLYGIMAYMAYGIGIWDMGPVCVKFRMFIVKFEPKTLPIQVSI